MERKRKATENICISPDVKEYIQEAGNIGESYDDVLRRLFGLPRMIGRGGGVGIKVTRKSKGCTHPVSEPCVR